MKMQYAKPLKLLVLLGGLLVASRSFAQYDTVWNGTAGDFLNPANWSVLVPTNNNTFNIDNGGTAIIDTNAVIAFNYFDLGDTVTGSGNLVISNGEVDIAQAVGDSYSQVGLNEANNSSWVLDGGTTYCDGPQSDLVAAETGYVKLGELWTNQTLISAKQGNAGVNQLVFRVGSDVGTAGAIGSLVLHSNAVLRIAHTLGMGLGGSTLAPAFQDASLIMDGNSELSIGDGLGSGHAYANINFDLSGDSHLVIGDTMGLGNTNGCSQQGYLTVGSGPTAYDSLTIRDNAEVDCMSLQSRANATILITNNASLKVFNVLAGSGTINYPETDSYLACQYSTNSLISVADHGLFYVDTYGLYGKSWSNSVNGLSIGNGGYDGGVSGYNQYAGIGTLEVRDFGTFDDVQGLHLGTYNGLGYFHQASEGILRVVGPNATIDIGGDLRLAINLTNAPSTNGIGMIDEVITGSTQSTIHVGGRAWLTNGVLKVELQGYTPIGGESYNLVSAGMVDGLPKTNDFSAAPLSPGLSWQVSATSTNLLLTVVNTNALPALTIQPSGSSLLVTWPGSNGILQSSTNVTMGWNDIVPTATSPYVVTPTNGAVYFRLRQ